MKDMKRRRNGSHVQKGRIEAMSGATRGNRRKRVDEQLMEGCQNEKSRPLGLEVE